MSEKIFLAGATGAIGTTLIPLLVNAGYVVYGSTRQRARAEKLKALGAIPILVDVFDAETLIKELIQIAPAAVIHQLTDLPQQLDPQAMAEAGPRNAHIRSAGTRNLINAALASGAKRMIAQSIAWAYASGNQPYVEESALDIHAEGARRVTIDGVVALETQVLQTSGLAGTVLRYGQLYGPGTWNVEAKGISPVHVDAAAHAALLALQNAAVGVFNITEDNPEVSNAKARKQLAWDPAFRARSGAKNGAKS